MSIEMLERQLADLQRRVENLESKTSITSEPSWYKIIGAAENDDLFDEAMRLGAEWRARANQEGH